MAIKIDKTAGRVLFASYEETFASSINIPRLPNVISLDCVILMHARSRNSVTYCVNLPFRHGNDRQSCRTQTLILYHPP